MTRLSRAEKADEHVHYAAEDGRHRAGTAGVQRASAGGRLRGARYREVSVPVSVSVSAVSRVSALLGTTGASEYHSRHGHHSYCSSDTVGPAGDTAGSRPEPETQVATTGPAPRRRQQDHEPAAELASWAAARPVQQAQNMNRVVSNYGGMGIELCRIFLCNKPFCDRVWLMDKTIRTPEYHGHREPRRCPWYSECSNSFINLPNAIAKKG